MALFDILNSTFSAFLPYPTLFVMGVSLVLTILVTLLNLVLIKKERRQYIKSRMRHFQEEMRKAQKEKNLDKMRNVQKDQMEVQMMHLKESLKISAVSILLLWLIFAWLQSVYIPTTSLDNGVAVLSFMGATHNVTIEDIDEDTKLLRAEGKEYELELGGFLIKEYQNDEVELFGEKWKVELSRSGRLTFNMIMAHVPIFGSLGFIGWYILTALMFGVVFRQIFDLA